MVIYFILNNFNFKLNLIKCLQHDIDNFLQMSVCLLSRLFIYVIIENVNAPCCATKSGVLERFESWSGVSDTFRVYHDVAINGKSELKI